MLRTWIAAALACASFMACAAGVEGVLKRPDAVAKATDVLRLPLSASHPLAIALPALSSQKRLEVLEPNQIGVSRKEDLDSLSRVTESSLDWQAADGGYAAHLLVAAPDASGLRVGLRFTALSRDLDFVMTDLDLGMNNWMSDAFPYPTVPFHRGKVLDAAAIEMVKETWGRYKDVDGDGIPYRTLPGTPNAYAAYFTRGSGHNDKAEYSEKQRDYVRNVDRLVRKFETARTMVPKPEIQDRPGATAGLLAYGTSHYGTTEARDKLATTFGVSLDYCRLRSLPLQAEAVDWMRRHERIYVVEQNRDGQLVTILRDELPELATRFVSVRQYNGLPLDATTVIDGVRGDAAASGADRSDAQKGGLDA